MKALLSAPYPNTFNIRKAIYYYHSLEEIPTRMTVSSLQGYLRESCALQIAEMAMQIRGE